MHLLLMFAVAAGIFFAVNSWLTSFTKHGETITVPDLQDLDLEQVEQILDPKNLRYKVIDSTYIVGKKAETVISQYPLPNKLVKENRKLFLTINAKKAPKVKMPNLIDKSFKFAELQFKTMGLILGKVKYVPDLAKNAVLAQMHNGDSIAVGAQIEKGSTIDLIIGDGYGRRTFAVPQLVGLPFNQAKFNIEASSLKIGSVIIDKSVQDTMQAIVHRQVPSHKSTSRINIGQTIDVFLMDAEKYEEQKKLKLKNERLKQEAQQKQKNEKNGKKKP